MSGRPSGRVVDPSVFATLDPPVLAGARCPGCATTVFPATGSCPRCSHEEPPVVGLPTTGTLWSWTEQRFAPKPPYLGATGEGWVPYAVGYVDLGDVIVETRLVPSGHAWQVGERVRLTLGPVRPGPGTGDVMTFAFEPAPPAGGAT